MNHRGADSRVGRAFGAFGIPFAYAAGAVVLRDYAPLDDTKTGVEEVAALPAPTQTVTYHGGPAVVQALDVQGLVAEAAKERTIVSMAWAVGDTVLLRDASARDRQGLGMSGERQNP